MMMMMFMMISSGGGVLLRTVDEEAVSRKNVFRWLLNFRKGWHQKMLRKTF